MLLKVLATRIQNGDRNDDSNDDRTKNFCDDRRGYSGQIIGGSRCGNRICLPRWVLDAHAPVTHEIRRSTSNDLAKARTRGGFCGPGDRSVDRKDRRGHGNQWSGGNQPRHGHRRCETRQHPSDCNHRTSSHGCHWYRCLPRNPDRRNLSGDYQTSLLSDQSRRCRQGDERGVLHRYDRQTRSGSDRHAQGCAVGLL